MHAFQLQALSHLSVSCMQHWSESAHLTPVCLCWYDCVRETVLEQDVLIQVGASARHHSNVGEGQNDSRFANFAH